MEITPVIYIYKGKCVSFYKGDPGYQTVYPQSPLNYAKIFASYWPKHIQIVDKEGGANLPLIKKIITAVPKKIQLAAKIRTLEQVDKLFSEGVERIIIGVAGMQILKEAIKKFGADKIFAGIKGKNGEIMTSKILPKDTKVIDYAETLAQLGVKNVLYHDIWSEGTMIHPNYDEVERLVNLTDLNVYASGGIGDKKHLSLLRETGAKGALIGKALYERVLNLKGLLV